MVFDWSPFIVNQALGKVRFSLSIVVLLGYIPTSGLCACKCVYASPTLHPHQWCVCVGVRGVGTSFCFPTSSIYCSFFPADSHSDWGERESQMILICMLHTFSHSYWLCIYFESCQFRPGVCLLTGRCVLKLAHSFCIPPASLHPEVALELSSLALCLPSLAQSCFLFHRRHRHFSVPFCAVGILSACAWDSFTADPKLWFYFWPAVKPGKAK